MRSRRLLAIVVAALILSMLPIAGASARRCPRFRAPHIVGHVRGLSGIKEISGLVASRRHERTFWVEQDSGDTDRRLIHAITPTGRGRASVSVDHATNHDWEDMAYWDRRLWIGDIGDNSVQRNTIQVYWFHEPRLDAGAIDAKLLTLRYPGGEAHNAEAMFVSGGGLFIVSKIVAGDHGTVYRADVRPLRDGAHRRLKDVGSIPLGSVTAADVGPRGIIVKNYTQGVFYRWSHDHRVVRTIHRRPCRVSVGAGESISFTTWNRSYYSIPEGSDPAVYLSRPR